MVDALMALIEAIFRFFQVKIKRVLGHPVELHQATLGIAPKALDAVDVNAASGEFIVAVADPQMFVKADIHQPVIAAPAVRVNHAGNIGLASDDGLKDDLGGRSVIVDAEKANARIVGGHFVRTRKVFRDKLRLHVSISHMAAQHRIQRRILTPAN